MNDDQNEYTPTTDRVRDTWTNAMSEGCASAEELADAMWDTERRDAQFDRWLATHDAEVLREAATELDQSIHHLDPAHPVELSYINCTRFDVRLMRDRADRIEGERL